MAEQYTSIKVVMDKIRRHPLLADVPLETLVDYTVDFMRIVGCPTIFEEKTAPLEIHHHRAKLPCDYINMIQVRDVKTGLSFRYATDSFHMSPMKDPRTDFTYKVQGDCIFTSIPFGMIEIAYEAMLVDKDGFPLIPDNSSFTRALTAFVKKQQFTILFDLGKISAAVLQNAKQEYAWAVGDCQTSFSRLSIDKAESFFNSWRTLILRTTEHRRGFIRDGAQEFIKDH